MAVSSISNMLNSRMRMSGLASGLDTDTMVKSMLAADQAKIDKASQNRQKSEWKRDAYREITTLLKTFKDDNFDVLKPTANMRSETSLAAFSTKYTQLSADTVAVSSNADAALGDHAIEVTQLATQAKVVTDGLAEDVMGSNGIISFPMDLTGKTINMTVDGATKSISLGNYATLSDLQTGIQAGLNTAFGNGRVTASLTGAGNNQLKFVATPGSTMSISADADVFSSLGFGTSDNKTNRISTSTNLQSIAGLLKSPLTITNSSANISFTINGKTIDVGKNYAQATIEDVISAVNKSDAGVEMKYNSLGDTITLKNKAFGATNDLTWVDTGDKLLESLGVVSGKKTNAVDAVFNLDGVNGLVRNTNSFTIEGNSYTLKQLGEVKISITKNTDDMVSKIKNFVTKYNDILDKINSKYSEKVDRAYRPLTAAEKDSMDADTITKWETKAKVGLLSSDSNISAITSAMRSAMFDKVDGVGITLNDIGISSSSYSDKGKLQINETKLKESLENNYSEVVSLFTKDSSTSYVDTLTDTSKGATRSKESGVANRLYDILNNNIRTTNGKGSLLTKAGMVGDLTEYVNTYDTDMDKQDLAIKALATKMADKSDRLYAKFAALETAMNKMNSQGSWLSQQTGK